ncbi:MAG: hypothetical protein MMC23_006794 [Stictis urceolatum]|nr:hypothetical protein [Stictis urceolata]
MVPAFALFGFISTVSYSSYLYVLHIPSIVESIGLCGLLELFVIHVTDTSDRLRQGFFFQQLEHRSRFKQTKVDDKGSLHWFRVLSFRVYQYPIVTTLTVIIEILAAAFLCEDGKPAKAVKVIVSILTVLTTMSAVLAIVVFYRRLKPQIKPHHGVSRLVAIKALIHVVIFQNFLISIIDQAGALTPTPTMSYGDLLVGIPSSMTCIEMLIFSVLFSWSFRVAPYKGLRPHSCPSEEHLFQGQQYSVPLKTADVKASPLQALIAVVNLADFFRSIRAGFKTIFGKRQDTVNAYSGELGAWPDHGRAPLPHPVHEESGPKYDQRAGRELHVTPPAYDGRNVSPGRVMQTRV